MVLTAMQRPVSTDLKVTMQTSLFGAAPLRCNPLTAVPTALDRTSSVLFQPGWLQGSDLVFEQLRDEMPWRAMERPMYDRVVAVPRLICTIDVASVPVSHPLAVIATGLESSLGRSFEHVGLNYYRDGSDSVAWHRDSVGRRYWASTTVVLVSVGSPRTLQVRPFKDRPADTPTPPTTAATRQKWRLGHGDLFAMFGASQRDWEHCVPKETSAGPRISLAFRCKEADEGPRIPGAGVPPLWARHKLQ